MAVKSSSQRRLEAEDRRNKAVVALFGLGILAFVASQLFHWDLSMAGPAGIIAIVVVAVLMLRS